MILCCIICFEDGIARMDRVACCILLLLALVACAPGQPPATATSVPTATLRPTSTPRPTATLVPTATPVPTLAARPDSEAQAALLAGVAASAAAQHYRAMVQMLGYGAVGAVGLGQPHEPMEVVGMQADFAGNDYAFTLTGVITAIYGHASAGGLQARRVAGQHYVYGPLPIIGAFQPTWYRLPDQRVAFASPPLYPAGLLALVANSGVDPSGFAPADTMQLDGMTCHRFISDRPAALAVLRSLGASGLTVDTNPEHIDSVGANLWVCPDGYLHQVEIAFAGTTPGDPAQPFDFTLTLHMYDFTAPVDVLAPQRAIDLVVAPR